MFFRIVLIQLLLRKWQYYFRKKTLDLIISYGFILYDWFHRITPDFFIKRNLNQGNSRSISLIYSWQNFKPWFCPGYHVIKEILTMHLKARYTKYHHIQSPFEDVQVEQYKRSSFYLFRFMSIIPFSALLTWQSNMQKINAAHINIHWYQIIILYRLITSIL